MHKLKRAINEFELYQELENISKKLKSAVADAAIDAQHGAKHLLNDSIDNIKDKAYHVQRNVTHAVKAKPIKSLAIVLAAGLVVGFFLKK